MGKLGGYDFYESLGSPQLICGPMVDGSELAFRMMVRQYGVDLAYTPMLNSRQYVANAKMRYETFATCPDDRPLVAQVAGDSPETLLAASRLLEDHVDAVDINFGCPQHIAKRGHYGAYLQDEWDLMRRLISTLDAHLAVPVWCKIRVFPEVDKTLAYAEMIQVAGCQALAVHGRTRECKGRDAGRADWDVIAQIKAQASVPVIANGDVTSLAAARRCLDVTKCDAVMAAYPLLENPKLFAGVSDASASSLAWEYLAFAEEYSAMPTVVRGHLFKLLKREIVGQNDMFEKLSKARCAEDFRGAIEYFDRKQQGVPDRKTDENGPVAALGDQLAAPRPAPVKGLFEDAHNDVQGLFDVFG